MSQTTHFKYKMEDVECKFCTEYRGKKRGCAHVVCPWLAERIEAGVVGYEEALLDSFPHDPRLGAKLRTAVQLFHGSLWLNEGHRQRMETLKAREGFQRRRDTPAYFAAMYLLTADPDTANRTANCFYRDGIMFMRPPKASHLTAIHCCRRRGTSTPTETASPSPIWRTEKSLTPRLSA